MPGSIITLDVIESPGTTGEPSIIGFGITFNTGLVFVNTNMVTLCVLLFVKVKSY